MDDLDDIRETNSRANVARKQVVNTVSSRRDAAAASPFSEDPGLRYWLSRQRWLWRKSKLDPERVKMLQLAGIDMDIYPAEEWRRMAHVAAESLQGTRIESSSIETSSAYKKIKVIRWIETQRALFLDGRLSPGQLRYMTFLGLTWVLSDKVVDADDSIWLETWKNVGKQISTGPLSGELQEWLGQQRALCYLNLLNHTRQAKLASLGIPLDVQTPTKEEKEWNKRLSELLNHSQEVGHADVTPQNEQYQGLHEWLQDCKKRIRADSMPPGRTAQLKALGVQ